MRKIRLDLEELAVDSFDTLGGDADAAGTVLARSEYDTSEECPSGLCSRDWANYNCVATLEWCTPLCPESGHAFSCDVQC